MVLVNFRGADDTIAAVEHLFASEWPVERLEIVVVDNASGDESLAKLKRIEGIRLVESKENLGFAGGCNLGVASSSGSIVAFLNNDARPDARWISAAIDAFEQSPMVGAVASKVLDWEGERVDYVDASITWYGMGYKPHAGEIDRGSWDRGKDVLFGTGAAMFVRAEVYEELKGFDESYFMFYEDVDLGWRLNLLGYRFRYEPRSLAFHKHHASMSKLGGFKETYLLERNALYTLFKNLDDESLAEALPGSILLAVRRAVARGGLDSTSLDLRKGGDDSAVSAGLSKDTLAGIFAIDQFVENLPALAVERERVQASRVRSDSDIGPLFGNTNEPAYPIDDYLRGYDKIVATLGQLSLRRRRRILIVTGDAIGERMAGPAIRAWNMADQLADEHDVRLVSMARATALDDRVVVDSVSYHHPDSIIPHERWADVVIVQGHALELFPQLERTDKVLVVDIYDPLHLEQLEQGRHQVLQAWSDQVDTATRTLNHQLEIGDFFLCASPQQRHFWLGQLAAMGRVNPYTYGQDKDLESLIAIAPFGIPSQDPVPTAPAMRGVIPGIDATDKIILWAGGLYDWFDPETLISAVAVLAERRPDVRLVFMGVKHPNPFVPEMQVVSRAMALATELGVLDRNVFFNETWVPYAERQNYLLEADLGVSTHFQHIETTFSFRTRILDYLWAGLPIVSTDGDSFGLLVGVEGLGASVPEQDVGALVDALERYLYDEEAIAAARRKVGVVRERFTWTRVLEPLVAFCRAPVHAADRMKVTGGGRRRKAVSLSGSAVVPARATGLRRDLQRVRYYLKEGGPSAVVDRVRARRARLRATRPGG